MDIVIYWKAFTAFVLYTWHQKWIGDNKCFFIGRIYFARCKLPVRTAFDMPLLVENISICSAVASNIVLKDPSKSGV